MLRAVLDANVFLSALIHPEGPPGRVVAQLLKGTFELVVSPAILAELRRSLRYPRVQKHIPASDKELDLWVHAFELIADVVEGSLKIAAVAADPEDDKYLIAALEGRAEFVVSGDAHLLGLQEYEGIRIVTPRAFLELLQRTPAS